MVCQDEKKLEQIARERATLLSTDDDLKTKYDTLVTTNGVMSDHEFWQSREVCLFLSDGVGKGEEEEQEEEEEKEEEKGEGGPTKQE